MWNLFKKKEQTMETELKIENLEIGQYVTVLHGPSYNGTEDHSFQGDVLRVQSISAPFVSIEHCYPKHPHSNLDTRRWIFGPLSQDYVIGLLGNTTEKELLTQTELGALLKLGRGKLFQKRKHPDFPKPVKATLPSLRWRKSDIEDWLNS